MSVNPISLARVSNLSRGNLAMRAISDAQKQMMEVQQQLTTGKRLAAPSDDSGDAAMAMQIRKLLESRQTFDVNLKAGNDQMSEVDTTLGSITDLVRQAKQIASQTVGSTVSAEERASQASVMDAIFGQLLTMANQSVAGTYLFGGDRSTDRPFVEEAGGVKWVGSSTLLSNRMDEGTDLQFQVDGGSVFGALSTMVLGTADLSPMVVGANRLSDLRGATDQGVTRGVIEVASNGTVFSLDLTNADTIDDVVDRINAAAPVDPAGTGLLITPDGATEVTVSDVGGGTMARDLGILQTVGAGAGTPITGAAISPKVSELTPLSQLRGGLGLDLTGLTITNGGELQQIDFNGALTVEDLLNRVNNSGTHVRARINAAGTGIDIFNAVQGISMRISENGGATADQLGLRSYTAQTKLADLNSGDGVKTGQGNELRISDGSGVAFEVDLDGADTVQDVIDRINAAAVTAGAAVGASFGTQSNGIVLTNTAGGSGSFEVSDINASGAKVGLGLDAAPVAGVITGKDVNPIDSYGLFGNIDQLRRAMRASDQIEMTRAASAIEEDLDRLVRVRGQLGARVQEFENRQDKIKDQNIGTQSLLSELEDTDFNEAIVKFQTLQTSLQASLQTTGQTLNLSLMDFLR
jgi:flagellar hook-associated protein 3 FlgL